MMRRDVLTSGRAVLIATVLLLPTRLIATTAADLGCGSNDPCVVASPVQVADQSVIDLGTRSLHIVSGGQLVVGASTTSTTAIGTMTINAAAVTIDSGGLILARGNGNTTMPLAGGKVTLNVGSIMVASPPTTGAAFATIDASGSGGGDVEIVATGDVQIPGPISNPPVGAIAARSLSQTSDGGTVNIASDTATIGAYIDVRGGGDSSASGGTFGVNTTSDLTISGTIDARGGDNGTNPCIDLTTTAGNATLTSTSLLESDATGDGGSGGAINIQTGGDGASTGLVTISGQISATGHSGVAGGGDGGDVYVDAAGNLLVDQTGAIHEDGGVDGGGSSLTLMSDLAAVNVQGTVSDTATGLDSTAGDGCLQGHTDVTIGGTILFTGGGTIDVCADTGSVTVQGMATIDASGDNGNICLDSSTSTVLVEGTVRADGGATSNGATGGAGEIDLEGQNMVRVSQSGVLHASATTGTGGRAGTFSIISDNDTISIDGALTAEGTGPNGAGASMKITAPGSISITGPIDGTSPVAGGMVMIQSDTGPVDIANDVDVSSPGGVGGSIMATGSGDMIISGTLTTDGKTGGSIAITGCDVTVCGMDAPKCPANSTGVLSSLGAGHNSATGKSSTAILGKMQAGNGGSNTLIWSGNAAVPPPFVAGQVTPPAQIVVDSTLVPCPACQGPGPCQSPTPFPKTPTPTSTPTPTVHGGTTPTIAPVSCVGDCDGGGSVGVSELIALVNILLGNSTVSSCPHGIPTGAQVNIALIIKAVNNLLDGCTM